MRSALFWVLSFIVLATTLGCSKSYSPPPNLPDPVVNQQVDAGDVLTIEVVGEDKLPKEYEISADGAVTFPYVGQPIKVSGLEPRQIATAVREGLISSKYLVDPQVQVKVKQYNSKKIQIIGQVGKQGPLPYQDGMTLVQAISAAGWFTPLADTGHVQIIRQVPTGAVNAVVSVDAITDNKRPDIKLQQGDTIKVDQRLF